MNIIVLSTIHLLIIKKDLRIVNIKLKPHPMKRPMIGWKSRKCIQQYRENLAKAGVFRWVTNIHEHKNLYMIIHYYLLRAFRTLHKSFHAKS